MPVNRRRLLELAAARLEAEKQHIDEEIAEIKAELGSDKTKPKTAVKTLSRKRTRRTLSAKERKVASERMTKYWAERKKKEKQQAKAKSK